MCILVPDCTSKQGGHIVLTRTGHARPTRLKFCGRKILLPYEAHEIRTELRRLCDGAQLDDVVRIHVRTCFTGIVTHPGVYVHRPKRSGVPLTWEGGDNWHVYMLLYCDGVSEFELYRRLTTPQVALNGTPPTGEAVAMAKASDPQEMLAKILEGPPAASIIEPSPQTPVTIAPSETPEAQRERVLHPYRAVNEFTSNTQRVDEFLAAIAKLADEQGIISTRECIRVLREDFGFPKGIAYPDRNRRGEYNMPYSALTQLRNVGILQGGPHGYSRIPADTLQRLRGSTSSTPGATVTSRVAVLAQPETETRALAPVQFDQDLIDAPTLLRQVAALRDFVADTQQKRTELGRLLDERTRVQQEAQTLLDRSKALTEQIAQIETTLQHEEDAQRLLAAIKHITTDGKG